jgi:hypothetical protein
MSDDPRRRLRRRRPIEVERLESRALLSMVRPSTSPLSRIQTQLAVNASSMYVNQQAGAFTVTLYLKKGIVLPTGEQPAAALDVPLTVDLSASLDPPGSGTTEAASPVFAPVHESVTIPAGASTETVTVPIISSVATPDPVLIHVSASAPASSGIPSAEGMVDLYSSPGAVPPTITSVQPVTQGKLASAVVVGFSKPMAQATVENSHNYRILSRPKMIDHPPFLGGVFGGGSETTLIQSFPIAAASYDPSTSTVRLTLKRPVKASRLYEISSAYPLNGHELTDTQGQPLAGQSIFDMGGEFTNLLYPIAGFTPFPVARLKSSMRTPSLWERLNPLAGFA